jgi:hypothetical protein
MKILYIGALYQLEYSLYKETLTNKDIQVIFCSQSLNLPGIDSILSTRLIKNKEDIAKIRDAFGPDLVIFRNWSGTEHLMDEKDVFWAQEISPKDEKEDFSYPVFDFPTQAKYILDCSKVSSKNNNRI